MISNVHAAHQYLRHASGDHIYHNFALLSASTVRKYYSTCRVYSPSPRTLKRPDRAALSQRMHNEVAKSLMQYSLERALSWKKSGREAWWNKILFSCGLQTRIDDSGAKRLCISATDISKKCAMTERRRCFPKFKYARTLRVVGMSSTCDNI